MLGHIEHYAGEAIWEPLLPKKVGMVQQTFRNLFQKLDDGGEMLSLIDDVDQWNGYRSESAPEYDVLTRSYEDQYRIALQRVFPHNIDDPDARLMRIDSRGATFVNDGKLKILKFHGEDDRKIYDCTYPLEQGQFLDMPDPRPETYLLAQVESFQALLTTVYAKDRIHTPAMLIDGFTELPKKEKNDLLNRFAFHFQQFPFG